MKSIEIRKELTDEWQERGVKEGVITFTPSWGDEFLTNLGNEVGNDNLVFKNTENPSVKATLELLKKIEEKKI